MLYHLLNFTLHSKANAFYRHLFQILYPNAGTKKKTKLLPIKFKTVYTTVQFLISAVFVQIDTKKIIIQIKLSYMYSITPTNEIKEVISQQQYFDKINKYLHCCVNCFKFYRQKLCVFFYPSLGIKSKTNAYRRHLLQNIE